MSTSASGAPHVHAKNVVISRSSEEPKFGTILTDGTTLYTLKPNATSCSATCHKYWIPVDLPKGDTKARPVPASTRAKLGTVKVKGGHQVTYGGKALYWFFEDKSAGQVKGNVTDTWGKWVDVVLAKPASKPATTTTTDRRRPRRPKAGAVNDHDRQVDPAATGHDDDDRRGGGGVGF